MSGGFPEHLRPLTRRSVARADAYSTARAGCPPGLPIPSSGARRFRSTSTARAFEGETVDPPDIRLFCWRGVETSNGRSPSKGSKGLAGPRRREQKGGFPSITRGASEGLSARRGRKRRLEPRWTGYEKRLISGNRIRSWASETGPERRTLRHNDAKEMRNTERRCASRNV